MRFCSVKAEAEILHTNPLLKKTEDYRKYSTRFEAAQYPLWSFVKHQEQPKGKPKSLSGDGEAKQRKRIEPATSKFVAERTKYWCNSVIDNHSLISHSTLVDSNPSRDATHADAQEQT